MKKYSLALFALAAAVVVAPSAFGDSLNSIGIGVAASFDQSGGTYIDFTSNYTGTSLFKGQPNNIENQYVTATGGNISSLVEQKDPVSILNLGANYYSTAQISNKLYEASAAGTQLFSVTDGKDSVSFKIGSLSEWDFTAASDSTKPSLVIEGFGTLDVDGSAENAFFSLSTSATSSASETTYQLTVSQIDPTVPEPSSLILLGTGFLGLAFMAFRKAKPAGIVMNL